MFNNISGGGQSVGLVKIISKVAPPPSHFIPRLKSFYGYNLLTSAGPSSSSPAWTTVTWWGLKVTCGKCVTSPPICRTAEPAEFSNPRFCGLSDGSVRAQRSDLRACDTWLSLHQWILDSYKIVLLQQWNGYDLVWRHVYVGIVKHSPLHVGDILSRLSHHVEWKKIKGQSHWKHFSIF